MTERQYLYDIKRKCRALETWRDEFERTVKRLSKIYCRIDAVEKLFAESGGEYIVEHVNNKGNANAARNPYIAELDILYDQALTYERELGLTAAALRKINETALKSRDDSPMAGMLKLLNNSAEG